VSTDLHVVVVPQEHRWLGRQCVQDRASRAFARGATIDRDTWRTTTLRTIDPLPNPDQPNGCCTGVSECVQGNSVGVPSVRRILTMADAQAVYTLATSLDPFPGKMPEQDTGSSGLAAAKAARRLGLLSGSYRWLFGGADEVVQHLMDDRTRTPVSIGTWWHEGMMRPAKDARHPLPKVEPTGRRVGGHQFTARGYHEPTDTVVIRCWWGTYRDVRIARTHLHDLLMDDGDAHVAERMAP
jgi:hypothetical protein